MSDQERGGARHRPDQDSVGWLLVRHVSHSRLTSLTAGGFLLYCGHAVFFSGEG